MKRILGFIGNLRIKRKLLVIFILTGIFPVVGLGTFLIGNTRNLIIEHYKALTEAENKRVKIIAFDVTYLATNASQLIFYDEELKALISRQYEDESSVYETYRDYTLFDNYMSNYTEISSITIYTNNKTMPPYKHFQIITDEVKQTDWYKTASDSKGTMIWTVDPAQNQDGHLFLVRKIPVGNANDFAILRIGVSNNFLKLMIRDSGLHSIMALEEDDVFFSEYDFEVGLPISIEVNQDNPQIMYTDWKQYRDGKALVSDSMLTPVSASNSIRILTVDSNAARNIGNITMLIYAIVAISLLVPLAIILLFSSSFSRRILTLRREMHKVAAGDFNIQDSFNGRDELSDVYADMKVMIGCIQNLYKEIYNEKLTKEKLATRQQRIEYEMLASQINPHFLFNTLETIRMKALINNDEEVAYITKLLGKSIRHVLEVGSEPVSLASELKYVKIYVEIQKFRYHEKINYTLSIDKDVNTETYQILPLLLQPIVENAIVHGLESKKDGGCVSIKASRSGGCLKIIVSDNGVGMGGDKLQALEDKLSGLDTRHSRDSIGLVNVSQRIKLFYGQEYGIDIESTLSKGTVVKLRLPSYEKEVD